MERAKGLILTIENLISTKTKQHIVGGLLFSAAIFLGALATTVLTTKINAEQPDIQNDQDEEEYEYDYET